MKALKGKTLMSLIYAMCLSIPLVSILSRVIYVQTNKNAYQSYSGQTLTKTNNINEVSSLTIGEEYYFKAGNLNESGLVGGYEQYINYELVEVVNNSTNIDFSQFDAIGFYASDVVVYYYFNNVGETFNLDTNFASNQNVEFKFKYLGNTLPSNNNILEKSNNFYEIKLLPNGYLDNVFDYSVSKLVNENNFGQLNFFSWFENLLLTDAQQNMLYVRFVNWYLNYALLVSLMQILFLCLMWFVNFSRKLLDRGMNYDW